jgi:hypothetical protein
MSGNVANHTIGLAIIENMGVAVGISEISHTIEKIKLLPVWGRHIDLWVSVDVGQRYQQHQWP